MATAGYQRWLPAYNTGVITGDTLVKTGQGLLHTITIAPNDAAPTAGNLDVYDNTTNSGTKIFSVAFTTAYFVPYTVILDALFSTGLYFDFTTTADVNVSPSYV